MKKRSYTHKVTAALLLAAMLAPLLYVAFHLASISSHRVTMHNLLKTSMLQTITLDSASIAWAEYGREILVNGLYFDVEYFEFSNGKAAITGMYDEQEEILHQQLREAQSSSPAFAWQSGQVVKWLLTLWALAATQQSTACNCLPVFLKHDFCEMLCNWKSSLPDKPPQLNLLG
jgi:hypothetical protein